MKPEQHTAGDTQSAGTSRGNTGTTHSGAEGAVWDALLTNLGEEDREHAQRRVWQSIEEDRARALASTDDDPEDGGPAPEE